MYELTTKDFCRNGRIRDASGDCLRSIGQKWCPQCKKAKRNAAFDPNASLKGGLSCCCRKCRVRQRAERRAGAAERPDTTAVVRFMANVRKIKTGCWVWTGKLNDDGHGTFDLRARSMSAHRAAAEIFQGRKLAKRQIARLTCGVPPCVNPDHVMFCSRRELSTLYAKENPFGRNAAKDCCEPHKHPFSPENTHWRYVMAKKGGLGRECIACLKLRKPKSTMKPNTREDALSARIVLLTKVAFASTKHLAKEIREDVRGELMAVLLAQKSAPRGEELGALVKKLAAHEWGVLPDRFGCSSDAPINEDGGTLLDLTADNSIWGIDPSELVEFSRAEGGND